MANKKVTPTQATALLALLPGPTFNPKHRPRNSLERLKKKGLVAGNRKKGWSISEEGKAFLETMGRYD